MTPEQAYLIQLSSEPIEEEIIITNEADLQRFNDEMRGKWREEHAAVIDEWKALTNNNE